MLAGWLWIVVVYAFPRICVSLQDVFQEASGESLYFLVLSLDL